MCCILALFKSGYGGAMLISPSNLGLHAIGLELVARLRRCLQQPQQELVAALFAVASLITHKQGG